ncbi:hypothetical protein, partial [Pseudonocardia sp. ICBG601]|uniref:hypothetical protein n=1 Tax=Pseudonocardia sp. ICBG601 TaxID=2846759 RepID=UPI001CF6842C
MTVLLGLFFHTLPTWAAIAIPARVPAAALGRTGAGRREPGRAGLPQPLRALGSGVTNTAGSTGAAIGLFVFPLLLAHGRAAGRDPGDGRSPRPSGSSPRRCCA